MSINKKALIGAMLLGIAVTPLALVAGRANAAPATNQPASPSVAQVAEGPDQATEAVSEAPETGGAKADTDNVQSGSGVQQTGQHSDATPDTASNR
ncbi:MAG: hypothetical protein EOT04_02085 [Candidatus Chaera renei]|uniref:Uncharacterized protein n=1 Tax=Candidatus Chaera renei TaxID=2506947 RepID=A0A4Q0AIY7_9BACT|nr:MAG: hypothetical protein EOT04_02085 [Candidatus Chaera renei]